MKHVEMHRWYELNIHLKCTAHPLLVLTRFSRLYNLDFGTTLCGFVRARRPSGLLRLLSLLGLFLPSVLPLQVLKLPLHFEVLALPEVTLDLHHRKLCPHPSDFCVASVNSLKLFSSRFNHCSKV